METKEYKKKQEDSQDNEKRRVPAVKRDSEVDEKMQSSVETKEKRWVTDELNGLESMSIRFTVFYVSENNLVCKCHYAVLG